MSDKSVFAVAGAEADDETAVIAVRERFSRGDVLDSIACD
jgi:hypothetical protein